MTDKDIFNYHGYREQCKHITEEMYELTEAIHDYELCDEEYHYWSQTLDMNEIEYLKIEPMK